MKRRRPPRLGIGVSPPVTPIIKPPKIRDINIDFNFKISANNYKGFDVPSKRRNFDAPDQKAADVNARRSRGACRKNPVKCAGGAAVAAYATYMYFARSENRKRCLEECLPLNWPDFMTDRGSGVYWESVESIPENGNEINLTEARSHIRNNCFDAETLTPTSVNAGVKLHCDMQDIQLRMKLVPDDGISMHDYIMVDGVCFVPSIRYQTGGDPICEYKTRDDLMKNMAEYRTKEGDPCKSCETICNDKHKLSPGALTGAAVKDLFVDGALESAGDALNEFWPGMPEEALYFIVMVICLMVGVCIKKLFPWPSKFGSLSRWSVSIVGATVLVLTMIMLKSPTLWNELQIHTTSTPRRRTI